MIEDDVPVPQDQPHAAPLPEPLTPAQVADIAKAEAAAVIVRRGVELRQWHNEVSGHVMVEVKSAAETDDGKPALAGYPRLRSALAHRALHSMSPAEKAAAHASVAAEVGADVDLQDLAVLKRMHDALDDVDAAQLGMLGVLDKVSPKQLAAIRAKALPKP